MFEVKDGSRTYQFNGRLLADSSSWYRGSVRWIEFELYRTENGSYILSRVGVSLVYHGASCPLVKRYKLQEKPFKNLETEAAPCEDCWPTDGLPLVFPEKYRYWCLVTEDPKSIINALYKKDSGGDRYLTHVAQRLLEDAADSDENIDGVYRTEVIP